MKKVHVTAYVYTEFQYYSWTFTGRMISLSAEQLCQNIEDTEISTDM